MTDEVSPEVAENTEPFEGDETPEVSEERSEEEREEKEPEKEPEKEEKEKDERKVPYGALKEERARRKEADRRIREMEARMDEVLKRMEPKEEVPDPEADPLKAMFHEFKTLKQELAELKNGNKEASQQNAAERARSYVQQREAEFVKETPDYYDALRHLQAALTEDRIESGMDDDDAEDAVSNDMREMLKNAIQAGKNPAEVAYRRAKRMGFGGTSKLDSIERGQKASLSTAGGAAKSRPTAKQVLDMSPEQFAEFMKDPKNFESVV